MDGTVKSQSEGISVTGVETKGIADDIVNRINDLKALRDSYTSKATGGGTDAELAVAAFYSEITFLERKLAELNFQTEGFTGGQKMTARQAAQENIAGMTV